MNSVDNTKEILLYGENIEESNRLRLNVLAVLALGSGLMAGAIDNYIMYGAFAGLFADCIHSVEKNSSTAGSQSRTLAFVVLGSIVGLLAYWV